ncbi:sigma-70 family RNA polymerase sigma factor [Cruoricaptor ignavus]|uniref:Sigma-70 family RNA polymerase sigma factor n=1 Tax=Cruoricaptor ignavus TaxID=1118202 RepID=A0A7M1T3D3_9FLAO|nr:sigma-70 family RNA polymerase sigma factor [Cruoricaptor ignavus]QOR74378.1 sigma-70 family RNA polymerase sigma factor [Cruoricaptor ignavus]
MEDRALLDLIEAAKNKDRKAQTKLINQYWLPVFSFVLNKVQDETVADEITVAVFSKVLNKLELYDLNFHFKTWILTIAQNSVIDFWRKQKRSQNEESFSDLNSIKNDFARSPEELLISDEEQERILRAIESLDANYQEIIRLRFYEEKSIKEIAEELGISISNTKVRIMRGKKILSDLLRSSEEI